jgi:hypothetical protein
MSLHNIAEQVRAQGRGNDSLLIHMTPKEVGGLQALAMANGGSLTINPQTGLPEAGFLESLLPAILGAGITVATGGAAAPWMIGAGIGGVEALRTGDVGKGLLAGLGAFGGAGLTGALTSAGGAPLAAAADTTNFANLGMSTPAIPPPTATQSLGAGVKGLFTDPSATFAQMGGLKGTLGNLGMAAAPVIADAFGGGSQQQAPEAEGNIRQFDYAQEVNPNFGMPGQSYFNQYYTPGPVTPASQFKGFADGGMAQMEERYSRPQQQADPAVAEYNQALMQRAQAEYNQSPQLAAFRSALPGQGVYDPQAGEAFRSSQQQQVDRAKEIQANQFGFQYDPITHSVTKDPNFMTDDQKDSDVLNFLAEGLGFKDFNSGGLTSLGSYSDGGQLLRGPGDGVSDDIPATIADNQPARLADGEFVIPARIVSEIGNGSTDAGAKRLYQMMDRIQQKRSGSMGKDRVAVDTKAYEELPA